MTAPMMPRDEVERILAGLDIDLSGVNAGAPLLEAMRDLARSLLAAYDDNARLAAQVEALTGAVTDIAKQKRTDELETEADAEFADFEGGYDACINVARAALEAAALADMTQTQRDNFHRMMGQRAGLLKIAQDQIKRKGE